MPLCNDIMTNYLKIKKIDAFCLKLIVNKFTYKVSVSHGTLQEFKEGRFVFLSGESNTRALCIYELTCNML